MAAKGTSVITRRSSIGLRTSSVSTAILYTPGRCGASNSGDAMAIGLRSNAGDQRFIGNDNAPVTIK